MAVVQGLECIKCILKEGDSFKSTKARFTNLKCKNPFFEEKMAYLESKGAIVVDRFHGERSSLWKLKMELELASMDLWDIMDRSKDSTFQCGSQSVEEVPKARHASHVHNRL